MPLSLALAHRRYRQQAGWTAQLRRHLFAQAGLANAQRVLEVGCGTGAVLQTIAQQQRMSLFGLDIDFPSLKLAKEFATGALLTGGDGHHLPYSNSAFDITFCHFVLLWLIDPVRGLKEMRRVTRPGGAVIAFAEPDYSARIDQPATLAEVGMLQTEALRAQGADPEVGRKLPTLFHDAGFENIESGELSAEQMTTAINNSEQDLEIEVLRADLKGSVTEQELQKFADAEENARQKGRHVLHVPTHYAWARV